ncbi:MAG: hypothetical protein HYX40_00925 [Sphingobacteriales bacterium]|nr:hypothetical protein [Sphingobacteriales bacterium]
MRLIPVCLAVFVLVLASCKSDKKIKTQADDDITLKEFVSFFPAASFPYTINDTVLNKKENDSLKVSMVAFKNFIPDSVYSRYFSTKNKTKPRLFLLAKGKDSDENIFLFLKSVAAGKKAYVFCFNKKLEYINSKEIAETDKYPGYRQYCEVNKSMNFKIVKETKKAGDQFDIKEDNFFLDNSGQFRTAVIISNKDLSDEVPVNPIDTLPRKNKFSADYLQDAKNIVSVRDAANAKECLFFIHFSKQNGDCTGELKGKAEIIAPNKAKFTDKSGPCGIEFYFTNTTVSIKEAGGCGSYRGITCFFEGSYTRKKEPVKPKEKKKKKK